ncbi:phenylacetate--CoA ligase family protein [Candidatus Neomarinimicrobiota bacterium]
MREFLIKCIRPAFIRDLDAVLKSQWFSAEQIAAEQNRKFINLIDHCRQQVPYYQEHGNLSAIKSIDDINTLPILTKDLINANNIAFRAKNYSNRDRKQIYTTGSTGKRLNGYLDRRNTMSWACNMRGWMWAGYRLGAKRILIVNVPLNFPLFKSMWGAGRNLLLHSTSLSVRNLSDEMLYRYSHTINNYKPDLIAGYTNALDVFASFLVRNNIKIHSPKGIVGSSEMMFNHQRERIERAFKTKVHNCYVSGEVKHIAGECEQRDCMHISCEHIYLEIVDEFGDPCPVETPGQILVTDLTNYAFPLIRYKIDDLGTLSDKQCECGRGLPLLKELIGKNSSVTIGQNGVRVVGGYWTDLLEYKFQGIEKFQVRQDSNKNFKLLLQVDEKFNQNKIELIMQNVQDNFGQLTKVSIQVMDKFPPAPGGKHQWIISDASPYL